MKLKYFRWIHKKGFSRRRLRGGFLHRCFGDNLFLKSSWAWRKKPVARAWVIGCLISTSPFFGFHLIAGLTLALLLRANLPTTIILLFTTNPLTAPIFYSFAYALGCLLLNRPLTTLSFGGNFTWLWQAGFPLFLGCSIIGLISGLGGYFLIQTFWKEKTTFPFKYNRNLNKIRDLKG
ncbi:MAG: DUF2062 domain-containing protein [Verrucomicrobiia bacterium]